MSDLVLQLANQVERLEIDVYGVPKQDVGRGRKSRIGLTDRVSYLEHALAGGWSVMWSLKNVIHEEASDIRFQMGMFEKRVEARFVHIDDQFADVRTEMAAGFAEVRSEMAAGLANVDGRLDVIIELLRRSEGAN